jgi:sialate O-acetylesterase
MEFELQNSKGSQEELPHCGELDVRCYNVPRNAYMDEYYYLNERTTHWEFASPETCKRWSAVGYYFAKKLSKELGVTVGIVNCNWGGTSGSAWVSRERLLSHRDTIPYVEEYDRLNENRTFEEYCKELEEYEEYVAQWQPKITEFYTKNPTGLWGDALAYAGECKYPGPIGCKSEFRPYGVYQTMLKRVAPYTLAGVVYYQGESDDHRPNSYYTLLTEVVSQWREDFHDDELPFMIVQLPLHMERGDVDHQNWCIIRQAQDRVHRTIKRTGLAVTLDLGEYGNIHPLDKLPVGDRLCLQALYHVYHTIDGNLAYGGMYKSHVVTNGGILVSFDYLPDGFNVTGDLTNFEISSSDGKYYPAEVKVCDNRLFLTSSEVKYPVHARYLWTNYAEVHLFSKYSSIPVAPFNF